MGKSGKSGRHTPIEGDELRKQRRRMASLARPLGYLLHPDRRPPLGAPAAVARTMGQRGERGSDWWAGRRKMPDDPTPQDDSENL